MQRIFFVENGDLDEVNEWLEDGAYITEIHMVPQNVSSYGYAGGRDVVADDHGCYVGNIYAYIVVEYN